MNMEETISSGEAYELTDEVNQPTDTVQSTDEGEASISDGGDEAEVDYAARVEEDLNEIRKQFPTLSALNDISELKNPLRFGALRDLGLTVKEAFLASGGARSSYDNRSHLTASVPKRASSGIEMSRKEYELAKDLFSTLSDSKIKKLYQRVTK